MPVLDESGFLRMTLPELIAQAQADIDANLEGADARLPQNNLDVLAITTSGLADEQLDAISFHAKQIHITTATGIGLERHSTEWGVPRKEATRATGRLIATITEAGAPMRRGARFQSATNIQVTTTADGVPAGPLQLEAPCQAVELGTDGNLPGGTRLTTVNPIAYVTGAVLADLMTGGTDQELEDAWRSRILDRVQRPPQGGAYHDYIRWALEVPGVTRAWCYPREQGTGTVVVRFAMDEVYPDGVPTQPDADRVLAYIEVRRPVTAEIFVPLVVPRVIDVTIRGLTPSNPATGEPSDEIKQAIDDELADMLFRDGEPGSVVCINWIWSAVSIASGVRCHKIVEPPDDVVLQAGELPVLGDVEYLP